jgi:hypothetical protein
MISLRFLLMGATGGDGGTHVCCANLNQALLRNVGTCRPNDNGETLSGGPARARVSTRGTGADRLVLALKSRNGDGAKWLDHLFRNIG